MRKKIPLIGGIINLIESLKGDIGIIENTDVATHSISAGSYVIWHNELYKASSAIAVDDALSSSNLTAVSGGAANELNNNLCGFVGNQIGETWIISSFNETKTVTEDCWVLAQIGMRSGQGIYIFVDGRKVAGFAEGSSSSAMEKSTMFPMKKGQTISFAQNGNLPAYPYFYLYKMIR